MANKIIEKMDKGEKAVGISLSFYADEMAAVSYTHLTLPTILLV